jgi:hypothetical protein
MVVYFMYLYVVCNCQVDDWYEWYELTHPSELPIQRRIYLATDEPKVLKNAREKLVRERERERERERKRERETSSCLIIGILTM